MDNFQDSYGILALTAAKKITENDEDAVELDDFIDQLEIVLQTVSNKIPTKNDNFSYKPRNHY